MAITDPVLPGGVRRRTEKRLSVQVGFMCSQDVTQKPAQVTQ